jgi:hypothetical protein
MIISVHVSTSIQRSAIELNCQQELNTSMIQEMCQSAMPVAQHVIMLKNAYPHIRESMLSY